MSASVVANVNGLRYSDTADHFENALLRLMNLRQKEFDRWLELSSRSAATGLLERLRDGWIQLRPPPPSPPWSIPPVSLGVDGLDGSVRYPAIAEAPSHGVAVADGTPHGWLVRWDGERYVRELEPPSYEEEYFEGDKRQAGGYGDYIAQAGWRREKSARQVQEMRDRAGITSGRVLDIGSGYGYFRIALGEAGFDHDGLEVSRHARLVASQEYGLSTYAGTLEDFWRRWDSRYDAVTLFDLIEHLSDPGRFLGQVARILRPGGVLGIKTPNINCAEAEVFGAHYHSLKREHLVYFSPESLTAAAAAAGFEPLNVATSSHLLVGFVGREQTHAWEQELWGADLVAWYRATGS
jgi:2-polyprenyl-3-methyl-5-hydroxy-6-metoxy-1,4-benzoquinol methylase